MFIFADINNIMVGYTDPPANFKIKVDDKLEQRRIDTAGATIVGEGTVKVGTSSGGSREN